MEKTTKQHTPGTLSFKQGSMLFKFTRLKFWEPATPPPPTSKEASAILEHCFAWLDITNGKTQGDATTENDKAVELAQRFFPDYDGPLCKPFYGGKKKPAVSTERKADEPEPATEPEKPARPAEDPKKSTTERVRDAFQETFDLSGFNTPAVPPVPTPAEVDEVFDTEEARTEPEPEAVKSETVKVSEVDDDTAALIIKMIAAGVRNIFLVGPAGCGKTTITGIVAKALSVPNTVISCSFGTPAAKFLGERFPEPKHTSFTLAYGQPGIITLDEVTTLDPAVASSANAALANGEIETTCGHVVRHADCVIISTANTMGDGGDRQYVSNNQLDAATTDRFAGCMVPVDYSQKYEAQFDAEVVSYVKDMRQAISRGKLRRIASTRSIINGEKLKRAGLDWRASLVFTWTPAERAQI
jgi:hypothetical protein